VGFRFFSQCPITCTEAPVKSERREGGGCLLFMLPGKRCVVLIGLREGGVLESGGSNRGTQLTVFGQHTILPSTTEPNHFPPKYPPPSNPSEMRNSCSHLHSTCFAVDTTLPPSGVAILLKSRFIPENAIRRQGQAFRLGLSGTALRSLPPPFVMAWLTPLKTHLLDQGNRSERHEGLVTQMPIMGFFDPWAISLT